MATDGSFGVVIGTGPLGLAVARELLDGGKTVRVVNRSGKADVPEAVEVERGDISDFASARRVCRGAESIYLCAKPPYKDMAEKFQPIMDGAIEAASETEAKLVYADSMYAYGPVSGPLTEDLPYAATGPKGRTRARLATQLMEAHEAGRVRATIGRASDFYGPGVVQSAVGERVFGFALAGKAASITGNPEALHTYTFVGDFAKGLVNLGEHDEAFGQIWHVPSAETLTTRQFIELVFEVLGEPAKIQVVPRWLLSILGVVNPVVRELPEILYQTEQPFVVDHSKYERAFGSHATPHRQAIAATLDWYRHGAGSPGFEAYPVVDGNARPGE